MSEIIPEKSSNTQVKSFRASTRRLDKPLLLCYNTSTHQTIGRENTQIGESRKRVSTSPSVLCIRLNFSIYIRLASDLVSTSRLDHRVHREYQKWGVQRRGVDQPWYSRPSRPPKVHDIQQKNNSTCGAPSINVT